MAPSLGSRPLPGARPTVVSEWVWDDAAATRWKTLTAELKAARVARQIVRDSEDPVARRLVDNWCYFSVEHVSMYEFIDGDRAEWWVDELRGRDQLEELSHTEALSELMRCRGCWRRSELHGVHPARRHETHRRIPTRMTTKGASAGGGAVDPSTETTPTTSTSWPHNEPAVRAQPSGSAESPRAAPIGPTRESMISAGPSHVAPASSHNTIPIVAPIADCERYSPIVRFGIAPAHGAQGGRGLPVPSGQFGAQRRTQRL